MGGHDFYPDLFKVFVRFYPEILWVMFALVTAGIAQGKNRNGGFWFFWSLILGPLALAPLVFYFEKLSSELPRKADPEPRPGDPEYFLPEGMPVPTEGDDDESTH